jgi:DNA helicase-2/ATP-dependent DNA helicase PcrA
MEEERRLMYVGITRAMDQLFLLYAKQRMLFGEFKQNAPSQFLMDIPEEFIEGPTPEKSREHRSFGERPIPVENEEGVIELKLSDGDRVNHKSFGEGVVINVSGGVVTVAFKDQKAGIKKLALSIAPLSKL